jgi:hypothetical protein
MSLQDKQISRSLQAFTPRGGLARALDNLDVLDFETDGLDEYDGGDSTFTVYLCMLFGSIC